MREIKFRAWSDRGQVFDEGFITDLYGGEAVYSENRILEQFTGLKDKNGVDIYEGDILESDWNDSYRYSVLWSDVRGGFTMVSDDGHDDEGMHQQTSMGGLTVIGNIHQNKDLLL